MGEYIISIYTMVWNFIALHWARCRNFDIFSKYFLISYWGCFRLDFSNIKIMNLNSFHNFLLWFQIICRWLSSFLAVIAPIFLISGILKPPVILNYGYWIINFVLSLFKFCRLWNLDDSFWNLSLLYMNFESVSEERFVNLSLSSCDKV